MVRAAFRQEDRGLARFRADQVYKHTAMTEAPAIGLRLGNTENHDDTPRHSLSLKVDNFFHTLDDCQV